jgi:hypothetical protein
MKKGKIALSFASPEKENFHIFIYAVITWEIFINGPVTTTYGYCSTPPTYTPSGHTSTPCVSGIIVEHLQHL